MSLLAPMLETMSWCCSIAPNDVGIGGQWCLHCLRLGMEGSGYVLGLDIRRTFYSPPPQLNLQEMFQFPNFTVLELNLRTDGHAYGPMVLNLLSMCTVIERLKLVIVPNTYMKDEKCWPSCPGDQPQNWRSQNISLTSLEEVEIENFKGNVHEVCFLKLLFRGAPLMKVTIKLAFKVAPSSRVCKDIYSIFKANPAVESHVYHENGEEVIYT
ncbi:unnamed protein product [Urochloa decumbens]|uniref:FBD domain-containing protein n=1 Tax=Urochloa decumbens TaxID=240449 RepID=A0ABC9ER31_9POAL